MDIRFFESSAQKYKGAYLKAMGAVLLVNQSESLLNKRMKLNNKINNKNHSDYENIFMMENQEC